MHWKLMMQTSSNATANVNFSRVFYQYLGIHSLLIGLFPFFAPVFLWDKQYSLAEIAFFVSLSGIGFTLALFAWDRLIRIVSLFRLMLISFVFEIAMLLSVSISPMTAMLVSFSLFYGAYNCFFWTTQRALFFETLSENNSGRKFGNFQIFVAAFLQIGIFIGGVLLEKSGLIYIYLISLVIIVAGSLFFYTQKNELFLPVQLTEKEPLSLSQVVGYKDQHNTRMIFLIDGFYLFLESFFWLISLFLLAHESFWTLGVIVVILAVIFFIIFVTIKNTIDHVATHTMYKIATVLYALSWLLRGFVDSNLALGWLFAILVVITFCTSYFRLAFNKRFYDLARMTTAHLYLIKKSYYSQAFIAVIYLSIGMFLIFKEDVFVNLKWLYWLAAPLALIYLCYGHRFYQHTSETSRD